MKSRGVYETPGGAILHFAHRQVESITMDREVMHLRDSLIPKYAEMVYYGFWFSPEREALQAFVTESQKNVTGTVRLKLYKGNIITAGRKSPVEAERRRCVLQVMDEECGHRLEGLQFLRLQDPPRKLDVEEARRDMVAHALQHVEVLGGECDPANVVADDHQGDDLAVRHQGQAHPVFPVEKLARVHLPDEGGAMGCRRLQVERARMFAEIGENLAGLRLVRRHLPGLGFGQKRGGRERHRLLPVVDKPDGHRKGLKDLGDELDDRPAQLRLVHLGCGALGESAPHRPVVVQGPLEMPADKAAQAHSDPVRLHKDCKQHQRYEDEQGFVAEDLAAAQLGDKLRPDPHDRRIDPRQEDRQGSLQQRMGRVNIKIDAPRPEKRPQREERGQQHGSRA